MHLRLIKILLTFAMMSVSNASNGERIGLFKAPAVADFSNALPIQFWPIECDTYNQNEPSGVFYRCYAHKWQCDDEVVIQFTENSLVEKNYVLRARNELGVDQAAADPLAVLVMPEIGKTVYIFSISADRYSICGLSVRFFIRHYTLGIDIAHSDIHTFKEEVKDTILITYYHHRNAFGLIYDTDGSPDMRFNLRIPARFYHQRTPKEQTDIVLSRQIVTTSTTMFKQRYLETDYLPYYMHEKIELALQHQFVEIYNKRWRQREPYELQEGNMKSPLKMAKCYLNEEAYVQRSVL